MGEQPYGVDLAWVHDAGFGQVAREAAAFVAARLLVDGRGEGLVVDLGCGSGLFLESIVAAGYGGHGVDLSSEMLSLAQKRVPTGTFARESIYQAAIPACVCVSATGEVINYTFSDNGSDEDLHALFARAYVALAPGGLLVLDIATPERAPESGKQQKVVEAEGWTVVVEAESPPERDWIVRKIITFRDAKGNGCYRRTQEVHEQRLLKPDSIAALLSEAGFTVEQLESYGAFRMDGWAVLVAAKPEA